MSLRVVVGLLGAWHRRQHGQEAHGISIRAVVGLPDELRHVQE